MTNNRKWILKIIKLLLKNKNCKISLITIKNTLSFIVIIESKIKINNKIYWNDDWLMIDSPRSIFRYYYFYIMNFFELIILFLIILLLMTYKQYYFPSDR